MADLVMDSVPGSFLQPGYGRHNRFLLGSMYESLKSVLGQETLVRWISSAVAVSALLWALVTVSKAVNKKRSKNLPPAIPGALPFLGNILQMSEAKPYKTFRDWSFKYGPIFTVKTGSINTVVINSAELCKEAFITKHSSISARVHYTPMQVLTCDKRIVAMSDYGPEHLKLKRVYVNNLLAPHVQKQNRPIREKNLTLVTEDMMATVNGNDCHLFDVSDVIKQFLYCLTMDQVFGYVPDNIFVPELGRHVGKWEMYDKCVHDVLTNVISFDWRDFFPALRIVGNKSLDKKLKDIVETRAHIIDVLIEKQRLLINKRGPAKCYADLLLTECADWEPLQIQMSVWEPMIEGVDSSLVTTEWTMFEIIRNPHIQERLYKEIKAVVGDRMVTEDDIDQLPLLNACIQETLRLYTALPLLPPRRVAEDITLGGYDVPKGSDILFNLYGVNMDPTVWKEPLKWNPDRFLADVKKFDWVRDSRMLPFGAGKRMCQAITQVFYVVPMQIATYLLHFEWTEPPLSLEERSAAEDTKILTTHKLHPLKAVGKPRVVSPLKFPEAAR